MKTNAKIKIIPYLKEMGLAGMAIYPFILLNRTPEGQRGDIVINHESIHIQQQKEMLVLPFFIVYLFNYLINLIIYRNTNVAYREICFEREAYKFEKDLNYLSNRKKYSSFKYLFKK